LYKEGIMIRSLTIIENQDGKGTINYQLSGDLPIEEAAKGIVLVAFHAVKKEPEKERINDLDTIG